MIVAFINKCIYNLIIILNKETEMKNSNNPPLPERSKYPFLKMSPGDYKSLDFSNYNDLSKAQVNAHNTSKRTGYKFITRKEGLTLQIWCIEKPVAIDPFFG